MHKRGKITLFYRVITMEEQNHGAGSNHAQESGASLNALLESIHRGKEAIIRVLSMQNRNRNNVPRDENVQDPHDSAASLEGRTQIPDENRMAARALHTSTDGFVTKEELLELLRIERDLLSSTVASMNFRPPCPLEIATKP